MAYSHDLLCPTDSSAPQPVGFCDRCGFKVYLADLAWQHQWAGQTMVNTRLLVHGTCLDVPNEQARTIVIGPDPAPLSDIRPGFQTQEEGSEYVPPFILDGEEIGPPPPPPITGAILLEGSYTFLVQENDVNYILQEV